ncbi:GlsB/YeaQ/YmgE family stress response membrane protein [Vineibacter terrae]|uniref:GlsB/YeaQ/YmgE family stress response membrane protein n=1 Tax=Vineibacter terrae TaxID=2586908 RepID=A0A5C8P7C6_9HYPH|nr:GlsB/YeaQ/YmgE family stress response membrane protein [Vineibacter terrae]TXL69227.1 GlsB/YeaQ/YmgE family stress response membrane protein [Vineibacter terrae]
MDIIITIVIGLIVGLIARLIMPGRDPGGIIMAIVIGIAGSLIATYGGQALGLYQPGQAAGFIGSVVGAVVFLILLRLIRRATGSPGDQA